ncbi:hypothetical protein KSD_10590 [Ktedonobacter sp. SOSP1-85]|nr:hypothetical protein KSD_10590 [Ktedonobacter sp. SOSP1-85]
MSMPTLREIRESNYISRKELSDLANVSESTIVRIEDPTHRTTQEVAAKVLEALSKRVGKQFSIDDVDGLNIYNVMRDRKQRTKDYQRKYNELDEAAYPLVWSVETEHLTIPLHTTWLAALL